MPLDMGTSQGGRRGRVFTLRLEPEHEALIKKNFAAFQAKAHDYQWPRPHALGSFIVWSARQWKPGMGANVIAPPPPPTPSQKALHRSQGLHPVPRRGKPPTSPAAAGKTLRALNARYGKAVKRSHHKKKGRK